MPWRRLGEPFRGLGLSLGNPRGSAPTFTQTLINLIGESSIIAYWDLNDPSGVVATDIVNGRNGVAANIAWAQPGVGDGKTSASFVPASSPSIDIFTALNGNLNGAEGSAILFLKASAAGVWTDGVERYMLRIRKDGNNTIFLTKSATNVVTWQYVAGGVNVNRTLAPAGANWITFGLTWSDSGNVARAYMNGAQVGADLVPGTWLAGALDNIRNNIGASTNAGATPWSGFAAHVIIASRPLTVAEMGTIVPF